MILYSRTPEKEIPTKVQQTGLMVRPLLPCTSRVHIKSEKIASQSQATVRGSHLFFVIEGLRILYACMLLFSQGPPVATEYNHTRIAPHWRLQSPRSRNTPRNQDLMVMHKVTKSGMMVEAVIGGVQLEGCYINSSVTCLTSHPSDGRLPTREGALLTSRFMLPCFRAHLLQPGSTFGLSDVLRVNAL